MRRVVRRPADAGLEVPLWFALFDSGRRVVRLRGGDEGDAPEGYPRIDGGWLAVPLVMRDGRVHGALHVRWKRNGEFDDDESARSRSRSRSIASSSTPSRTAGGQPPEGPVPGDAPHELRTPPRRCSAGGASCARA
jgi:hypothetical protein